MAAARPPSEQGIEYQLLDAINDLKAELQTKPVRVEVKQASWPDEIPGALKKHLNPGGWIPFLLPTAMNGVAITLQLMFHNEGIDLTLKGPTGRIIYWRKLVYDRTDNEEDIF